MVASFSLHWWSKSLEDSRLLPSQGIPENPQLEGPLRLTSCKTGNKSSKENQEQPGFPRVLSRPAVLAWDLLRFPGAGNPPRHRGTWTRRDPVRGSTGHGAIPAEASEGHGAKAGSWDQALLPLCRGRNSSQARRDRTQRNPPSTGHGGLGRLWGGHSRSIPGMQSSSRPGVLGRVQQCRPKLGGLRGI